MKTANLTDTALAGQWISLAEGARIAGIPYTNMKRLVANSGLKLERLPGMRPRINADELRDLLRRCRGESGANG